MPLSQTASLQTIAATLGHVPTLNSSLREAARRNLNALVPGFTSLDSKTANVLHENTVQVREIVADDGTALLEITMQDGGERLLISPETQRIGLYQTPDVDLDKATAFAQALMIGAGWSEKGVIEDRGFLARTAATPVDAFAAEQKTELGLEKNQTLSVETLRDSFYDYYDELDADIGRAMAKGDQATVERLSDQAKLAAILAQYSDSLSDLDLPAFALTKRSPEQFEALYDYLTARLDEEKLPSIPFKSCQKAAAPIDPPLAKCETNIQRAEAALNQRAALLLTNLGPTEKKELWKTHQLINDVLFLQERGFSWIGYKKDMPHQALADIIGELKKEYTAFPARFPLKDKTKLYKAVLPIVEKHQKKIVRRATLRQFVIECSDPLSGLVGAVVAYAASPFALAALAVTAPTALTLVASGALIGAVVGGTTNVVLTALAYRKQGLTPPKKGNAFLKGAIWGGASGFGGTGLRLYTKPLAVLAVSTATGVGILALALGVSAAFRRAKAFSEKWRSAPSALQQSPPLPAAPFDVDALLSTAAFARLPGEVRVLGTSKNLGTQLQFCQIAAAHFSQEKATSVDLFAAERLLKQGLLIVQAKGLEKNPLAEQFKANLQALQPRLRVVPPEEKAAAPAPTKKGGLAKRFFTPTA